ncbi:MAG: hypothetical protein ACJ780_15480 [Solirubrobacteraceae bacterium]
MNASAGTVAEGDEIAGFEVVDPPGHAPGLIGLFRRSDGLALISVAWAGHAGPVTGDVRGQLERTAEAPL